MNFYSHKLILKAVLGGLFFASAVPADAGCHGRSGGYSSGRSYGSSHSSHGVYSRPVHSGPVYHKPVYQDVYQPPVYSQPVYSPPVYSQPTYPQSQPVYSQSQAPYVTNPQTVTVSAQQSYPVNGQLPPAGSLPTGGFSTSGLPTGSQPQNAVGFPNATIPVSASAPNAAQNVVPNTAMNVAQNPAVQIPPAGSVTPAIVDAQQSALQALGGFAPPEAAVDQSTTVPQSAPQVSLSGAWTASLANGSRVQLSLQPDGTFSWTAVNKDGQSSVFQGTYATQNGSLSLTRGNDGQKLEGSLTLTGPNTFSFQLSAAQSASLDFVRG